MLFGDEIDEVGSDKESLYTTEDKTVNNVSFTLRDDVENSRKSLA